MVNKKPSRQSRPITVTLPQVLWDKIKAHVKTHPSFNFSGWVQEHLAAFFTELEEREKP
jgi:hypothetical protein